MTLFRIKPGLVVTPISEHVSFSDEGVLLETLEFLEISYGSCQPLNFLPYAALISFPPFYHPRRQLTLIQGPTVQLH